MEDREFQKRVYSIEKCYETKLEGVKSDLYNTKNAHAEELQRSSRLVSRNAMLIWVVCPLTLLVGFSLGAVLDNSYIMPTSVHTVSRDSRLDIVIGTRQDDKKYQFIQQGDGSYIELSTMVELERKKLEERIKEFEKSFEIR